MHDAVRGLESALKDAFTDAEIRIDGPTSGNLYFVDMIRKDVHVVIELHPEKLLYGLSILDDDSGYGMGCDCSFGHLPTLVKYLKRFLGSEDQTTKETKCS